MHAFVFWKSHRTCPYLNRPRIAIYYIKYAAVSVYTLRGIALHCGPLPFIYPRLCVAIFVELQAKCVPAQRLLIFAPTHEYCTYSPFTFSKSANVSVN